MCNGKCHSESMESLSPVKMTSSVGMLSSHCCDRGPRRTCALSFVKIDMQSSSHSFPIDSKEFDICGIIWAVLAAWDKPKLVNGSVVV